MATPITIAIPKEFHNDLKEIIKKGRFSVKRSTRKNEITENGFPRWLEERALEVSKTSTDNDVVLKTDKDVDRFFKKLHREVESERHGKSS